MSKKHQNPSNWILEWIWRATRRVYTIRSKRKTKENVCLLLNETVDLVTKKVINALFTLVFTGKTSLQELQVSQTSRKKVQSKEDLSSVEQDWVRDHLKKNQTYTSLWDLIGCTHKAGQPHCNPWEGEAANSLEHHFQEHGGQEAWIYMYVMLNQPDFLLWWND